MLLEVTYHDIDNGKRYVPCACAVAKAYTRATGHKCIVGPTWILDHKTDTLFHLCPKGVNLVSRFDKGFEVTPETLELTNAT